MPALVKVKLLRLQVRKIIKIKIGGKTLAKPHVNVVKKNIESGIATFTLLSITLIVMITDVHGNAVAWSSAGALGFKGSRNSHHLVAQMASEAGC